MKDKILYLTEWPADVGIAKSIKEKHDCEIYALIDTNKYLKKFFQEQQLLQYEKVWYYRDHILKSNQKPDLEYLTSFEKKYEINLWMIAYSDRIFYQYNDYHKFTRNEILLVFEQECRMYEQILDEVNPDFAIIRSPDYNQSQLLMELCKARGIKILTLSDTRFGDRCIVSERTGIVDNFEKIFENYSNKSNKSPQELYNHLKKYSSQMSSVNKEIAASAWKKFQGSFRYLFLVCNEEYRQYYAHYGRTKLKSIVNESSIFLKKLYRESFINKKFLHKIDANIPFVYFPLHFQPERSTIIDTPFYTNQAEIIKWIAQSLPIEYTLYVKEHPIQFLNGWRNTSFYKTILDMPNVKLLHPSVLNDEILKNCSLVMTITGTLALEAAFYMKPSIVLGDVNFSALPSVYRLKIPEELPQVIRSLLNKKFGPSYLDRYVNCVIENSFEHNFFEIYLAFNHFFYGGFLYDIKIPTLEATFILEKNKPLLDKLALEYIKKIDEHKSGQ